MGQPALTAAVPANVPVVERLAWAIQGENAGLATGGFSLQEAAFIFPQTFCWPRFTAMR